MQPAQLPVLNWSSSSVPPGTTSTIRSPPGPRWIQLLHNPKWYDGAIRNVCIHLIILERPSLFTFVTRQVFFSFFFCFPLSAFIFSPLSLFIRLSFLYFIFLFFLLYIFFSVVSIFFHLPYVSFCSKLPCSPALFFSHFSLYISL